VELRVSELVHIADDLGLGVELHPHEHDPHHRFTRTAEPPFVGELVDALVTGVETLLARYAAFDDYLRDERERPA
jgi:sugar phosphate isomerase/epimerase